MSPKSSVRNAFVALLGVVLVLLLPAGWAALKRYQLSHSDHARVLAACREALANKSSYRNDRDRWGWAEENDVILLPPLPDNFPAAIRELHPRDVMIKEDSVIICFTAPFARVCILGFAVGVHQYGTQQYIDGLWFWDGNKSKTALAKD
jgi:hypothetical protein